MSERFENDNSKRSDSTCKGDYAHHLFKSADVKRVLTIIHILNLSVEFSARFLFIMFIKYIAEFLVTVDTEGSVIRIIRAAFFTNSQNITANYFNTYL